MIAGIASGGSISWLVVSGAGRSWSFPLGYGDDEVVVIGGGHRAQIRLERACDLSCFLERTTDGVRLVYGYGERPRLDGVSVAEGVLLPPVCRLEVAGVTLLLRVRRLPQQSYPAVDDQAETSELPFEDELPPEDELPTTILRSTRAIPIRGGAGRARVPESDPHRETLAGEHCCRTQVLGTPSEEHLGAIPATDDESPTPRSLERPRVSRPAHSRTGTSSVKRRVEQAISAGAPEKQRLIPLIRRPWRALMLALAASFLMGMLVGGVARLLEGRSRPAGMTPWAFLGSVGACSASLMLVEQERANGE